MQPFDENLVFSTVEPLDDQRWSTWPATTPSERGPQPRPEWVVTSAAAIDTELGVLKTGKEADVFLIERAVPDDPAQSVILAAKRYRGSDRSDFHRSAAYTEGRRMRRSRDTRAVASKSAYGRAVAAGAWALAEFGALSSMYEAGVPVPYPVQVSGTEVLMEFIGTGTMAAPRLAAVRRTPEELRSLFEQVREILVAFARAGCAHGDLSPYNLLVHDGRVVVIDLPQVVDIVANPNGMAMLERDCVNVCDWFVRRGLEVDAGEVLSELVGYLW